MFRSMSHVNDILAGLTPQTLPDRIVNEMLMSVRKMARRGIIAA